MRLNIVIMTGLTRTPEPEVIGDGHGCQNVTMIYLGHTCKGRLYHLTTTLLKHQRWFHVVLQWDRSYGKEEKTMRCRKWRWNPNLYEKSWKNDFYQRTFKSGPSPKKIPNQKVQCIVTSNEKLKNHIK
jgi:hypothetical protein